MALTSTQIAAQVPHSYPAHDILVLVLIQSENTGKKSGILKKNRRRNTGDHFSLASDRKPIDMNYAFIGRWQCNTEVILIDDRDS